MVVVVVAVAAAAGLVVGGELSWRYAWRRYFEGTAAD